MDAQSQEFVEGLESCFAELNDPRVPGRCRHLLIDILAIALLAVLCGGEDSPDIEEFGKRRKKWLRTFLQLPGGIPSHDTFRRVFGLLDRKQFAACLFQWTQAIHEAVGGKLIAIDGRHPPVHFPECDLSSFLLEHGWPLAKQTATWRRCVVRSRENRAKRSCSW